MTGSTTQKLRPSPYLLQVTSRTLFFPVRSYSLHTFHSERTPESHNLTHGRSVVSPLTQVMVCTDGLYMLFCRLVKGLESKTGGMDLEKAGRVHSLSRRGGGVESMNVRRALVSSSSSV